MNKARLKLRRGLLSPAIFALLAGSVHAQSVDQVLQADTQLTEAARANQTQVDTIFDATNDLLDQYSVVAKEVEGLKVFNAQLQLQINDQQRRMTQLRNSIEAASTFEALLAPVMVEMIESLAQFIELDMPFNLEARRDSVERLRRNLGRSDITSAEKFRQILEVYGIEQDYGLNIETYESTISLDGGDLDVNILRVGRVALLYQTLDQAVTGAWDNDANAWVTISSGDYRKSVADGIRVAKRQAAIDILSIPVPAPQG